MKVWASGAVSLQVLKKLSSSSGGEQRAECMKRAALDRIEMGNMYKADFTVGLFDLIGTGIFVKVS